MRIRHMELVLAGELLGKLDMEPPISLRSPSLNPARISESDMKMSKDVTHILDFADPLYRHACACVIDGWRRSES